MIKEVVNDMLIKIQEQIFNAKGMRTDAHVLEGVGVLFVPENAPLLPQNVLLNVPYGMLIFGNLNIKF